MVASNPLQRQAYFCRRRKPVILKIRSHLQAAGFLHSSRMISDVSSKVGICKSLLGKVPNKFEGGQISMNWLRDNFEELLQDPEDRMEEWQLHLVDFNEWNHGSSYMRPPEELEDIRFLLDQRSKAEFGWRQRISPPLPDLKELHKVDMWGKDNNDWAVRHGVHIEAWDCRMQSLPICESFFPADTVAVDDYLAWFRVVGKLYLLPLEARS
ncbi:hypothetical protein GOBAR_DD05340 [Gossypium barbadense]|nr:hypothetical protein GOBAR_DD05340 [Gossypium barbadense]